MTYPPQQPGPYSQPPQYEPPVTPGTNAQRRYQFSVPSGGPLLTPPAKKKPGPLRIVLGVVLVGLFLCVGGTVLFGLLSDSGSDGKTEAASTASASTEKADSGQSQVNGEPGGFCATSQLGKHISVAGEQYTCGGPKPYRWLPDHAGPAAGAKPTIKGDDLVHVGEDVPAGTYRVATAVDGDCYWKKSKDAEGDDIIDNDIPAGGRPQVTLKSGQWFTSKDCPDWIKK